MVGQLKLNLATGRIELNGHEFHCGEPLHILMSNDDGVPFWFDTRLEYADEWYLVCLSRYQVDGLIARIDE